MSNPLGNDEIVLLIFSDLIKHVKLNVKLINWNNFFKSLNLTSDLITSSKACLLF